MEKKMPPNLIIVKKNTMHKALDERFAKAVAEKASQMNGSLRDDFLSVARAFMPFGHYSDELLKEISAESDKKNRQQVREAIRAIVKTL